MNAFRSLIANIYSVADATALVYLFHELEYGLSLVGIASILPQLRLLIQQYFDIGGLRCFILRPIKSRFCSYQGTWQATEIWQSPLAA